LLGESANNPPSFDYASVPSGWSLCRKIHLPVTKLTPAGRGTRDRVSFLIRALNSSSIALYQWGSCSATRYEAGMGE
jgi:hypothetical protein